MLKVENVTKYYGDFKAVDNLSFEVKKGEIFGLLGANGAGKTTTFRMIMGLLTANEGKITLEGEVIDYTKTDDIGFLTEERSLLLKLTVLEQAIYYGSLKGMSKEKINERLDELLSRFGILEYKNKKIKELSKGNQQKIQFIMATLNHPKLLILDEPFSGLDPFNIELFKKEILTLSKEGSMIIFSSHRMDHVEYFCQNIVILAHGKSLLQGNLEEIKESYGYKNIMIDGDIDKEELLKIKGVISVRKEKDYIVKVEDKKISDTIFKSLSGRHITKYVLENPSLNEIFIDAVGDTNE